MQVFLLLLLITVGTVAAASQSVSKTGAPIDQKKLAEQTLINNLIFDARSQPPEIAADALITIVESGRVNSIQKKREILQEAFNATDQAQYPVRIRYAGPYTDNRVWAEYNPLDLKLDALSLRLRVVKALLKFDKERARKLFLKEIEPDPRLPSIGCEDAMRYYDVSEFYTVAVSVINDTFSPKERREQAFLFTVLPYIDGMTSPAQVNPVAKMIVDLNLAPTQLTFLGTSYMQALGKVRSDEYSFRNSVSNTPGVTALLKAIRNAQPGDGDRLADEFRGYVLKQLNGNRCSDGLKKNTSNPTEAKYELPNAIKGLNQDLLKETPILAREVDPEKITKTVYPPDYWEGSLSGAERLEAVRRLRFKTGQELYTEDDKLTPEWQIKFEKFLLDLRTWNSEDEDTPEDYFNKKSIVFFALIEDTAPRGRTWDTLSKEYILFLRQNELRGKSRLQWYWHVRYFAGIAKRLKEPERSKLFNAVDASGNAALELQFDLVGLESKNSGGAAAQSTP